MTFLIIYKETNEILIQILKLIFTRNKNFLMFFDSVLSNAFLILASSSSIYVLGKHSYDQYSNLQLHFISASIGIFGFCFRSTGSLIYNLFFRTYPIDPREIEDESSRGEEIIRGSFRNYSPFDRIFLTMGLSGLVYAFYQSNQKQFIGSVLVFSLTTLEFICAVEAWKRKRAIEEGIFFVDRGPLSFLAEAFDDYLDFYWIIIGGFYGWIKGNRFCLLSFLPYTISTLIMSSEVLHKNPTVQSAFHDYMIIAHILLMTEAICQAPLHTRSR